ncbi:MAG: sensor histidine kinase [Gammaproteobacteria bacterium]
MSLIPISHHQAPSKGPPSTNAERRFKRLLAITLVASVAVLFISSLLTAWFIGQRIENTIVVQIDRVMGSFAENSINVFLLNDPTVARSTAASLRSLPSIRTVAFLKRDYTLLFRTDEVALPRIPAKGTDALSEGSQHWEDAEHIHFLAPVTTRPTATPFERSHRCKAADANRLGYFYVALDRGVMTNVKTFVFFVHALVVTICGSALLRWFRRRVRLMDAEVALMTAQLREAYGAALTADRHKDEFLAIVTHELRQPLACITGFTELALQEMRFLEQGQRAATRMRVVLETGRQMLGIVDELLAFAKVAAGKAEAKITTVDVGALAARAGKLIEPALLDNGNRLQVHTQGATKLRTDGDKLFHIVTNLLSNACKFTHEGTIMLTLSVTDKVLHIVVTDTGIGIAEEHQALIFEPFRQVDMSDTRRYRGTGMGLAITKNYCELLGGTIKVESTPGVGSTFEACISVEIPTSNS